ncbi:L-threonylcarbamoyladenylate synthase [Oceanomicrobium pacificus]|uniref:Threonylcarbamoyl-AMP synthase n=1 Tax=Oceanomicrobium pacificus TaxID=2692916 RepID=A0A6B0U0S9_9RHOB|nr:L-threonylcarbamoyladenylate synthase [Oceanomicrobium pacificus]MXU66804.1 threonylcarbamoyl-AMP synthase [Oceanomicrobium pacificus]
MADPVTQILPDSAAGIARAAEILRDGGRVAFPTETVYGLGADARSDAAVAGIFAAKDRPRFNPLIVHLPDRAAVEAYVDLPEAAGQLADAFWPGPLTLVLPRRAGAPLSDLVTSGLPTLGVRVPAHPLGRALLEAFGAPVAGPSANPSGRVSPTSAAHVADGLSGRIEAILDGGACPVGLESTIVGFDADGAPVLLRPGGIPRETIEACLCRPLADREGHAAITAPGQLASHYAPDAHMRLDADRPLTGEAWLGFGPDPEGIDGPALNLSPTGDLHEAAARLFAAMREIDNLAADAGLARIAVAPIPMGGLGAAINDRLGRAAAPRPDQPA